jgi:hypothetical protein
MSDGAKQGTHPDSDDSGDTGKAPVRSGDWSSQPEVGPGELGVALSHINAHLRDLDSDQTLPRQERDNIRLFYTHECNKLQFRLAVLDKREKVQFSESALEEVRKALELAMSESGREEVRRKWETRLAGTALGGATKSQNELSQLPENPEADEIRKVELQHAQAEASLNIARSELQAAFTALERLCPDDSKLEERKTAAKRWVSRRTWEAITPDELRPAVKAIRASFDSASWQAEQSTMKLCYAALQPTSPKNAGSQSAERLAPYKRFLAGLIGPHAQQLLLGADNPAPVIFKGYLDVFETSLKIVVRMEFQELFEIAKARTELLSMHPVEWTKRHLEILVSALKFGARSWIREVCEDSTIFRATGSREDIFSGHFRVPRLIHMRPSGNTPYDAASA